MAPPSALSGALTRAGRQDAGLTIIPFGSSAGGPFDMAEVYSDSFSGVALVNLATWSVSKPIEAFAHPATEQAGGFYSGRYAVWKVYHSLQTLDDFTVWDWRRGRSPTVVGRALRTPSGTLAVSPWYDPVLWRHYAAWVEGMNARGRGRVVLLDTASGKRMTVRVGHPASLAFYRGLLVWAESPAPGALTQAHAYSISQGARVTAPAALGVADGASSYVALGRRVAYVGADGRSLWVSENPQRAAVRLLRLASGGFNPPLIMSGPLVLAATTQGVIVANVDTGASFIERHLYDVTATRSHVLFAPANTAKVAHPTTPYAVLETRALSSMSCP